MAAKKKGKKAKKAAKKAKKAESGDAQAKTAKERPRRAEEAAPRTSAPKRAPAKRPSPRSPSGPAAAGEPPPALGGPELHGERPPEEPGLLPRRAGLHGEGELGEGRRPPRGRARRRQRQLLARAGRLAEGPRPREGAGLPDVLRHRAGHRRARPRGSGSAGATLAEEPKDEPWGGRDFAVVDPDGFKITIASELLRVGYFTTGWWIRGAFTRPRAARRRTTSERRSRSSCS